MPMIFDEDRDGLADMHSVTMLWLMQQWLLDQTLSNDALLAKVEPHIISVMKNNKSSNADEYSQQMGVSNDIIAAGWAKIIERHPSTLGLSHSSLSLSSASTSILHPNPLSASSSSITASRGSRSSLAGLFGHTPNHTPSPVNTATGGAGGGGVSSGGSGSGGCSGGGGANDSLLDSSSSTVTSSQTAPAGNLTKIRKMFGAGDAESSDNTAQMTYRASPSSAIDGNSAILASNGGLYELDFLEDYMLEHREEFQQREHEMSHYIESHAGNARKGRQRGSSRAERELAETERLSRTIAARRVALTMEPITPLNEDDKHTREIAKQRKAETKEQKEIKTALAKQKPFRIPV